MDALITLASATLGRDFRAEARELGAVGLAELDAAQLALLAAGRAG
jgi:hypothetical protein